MPKLRIPVLVLATFFGLAVALQAEFLRPQQFPDYRAADPMAHRGHFTRQSAQAFARPTQRRQRIAPLARFDR